MVTRPVLISTNALSSIVKAVLVSTNLVDLSADVLLDLIRLRVDLDAVTKTNVNRHTEACAPMEYAEIAMEDLNAYATLATSRPRQATRVVTWMSAVTTLASAAAVGAAILLGRMSASVSLASPSLLGVTAQISTNVLTRAFVRVVAA